MKKGLFATVIVSVVLAVSLCVYTIVAAVGGRPSAPGYTPVNTTFDVACRTGDILSELSGYSIEEENLSLTFEEGVTEDTQPVKYNELTGNYEVAAAGSVTAVTTEENGDTKTYNFTCYNKGDGSLEAPLTICNARHLTEFQALTEDKTAEVNYLDYNIVLVDNIDLANVNWMPIGDNYRPFTGSVDGNGYTVANMNISVNAENYTDYISLKNPNLSIELGFFGKTVNAEISDLNFKNASILLASDVLTEIVNKSYKSTQGLAEGVIGHVAIGTVAGMMSRTTYTSTIENTNVKVENSSIQGFSYNGWNAGVLANGIGGVVGVMTESQLSNIDVTAEIFANYQIDEASTVGGIAGFISAFDTYIGVEGNVADADNKSKINNASVSAVIQTRYKLTNVSEENYDKYNVVGLVAGAATNVEISDVVVKNSTVTDPAGTVTGVQDDAGKLARVSAGVAEALRVTTYGGATFADEDSAYNTILTNFVIENINVDINAVFGTVACYVGNGAEIVDAKVSGVSARALTVAGVAVTVAEGGVIRYTEASKDVTMLEVNLRGVKSAGLAVYNSGVITGYINDVNQTTTNLVVNIEGFGADIDITKTSDNDVFAAGLVGYMYSTTEANTAKLENFTVIANMQKSVNYSGVVHSLGKDATTADGVTYYNTVVENITVNMNAVSFSQGEYSTTKKVAGAVATMHDYATLKNVNVLINLNADVDKTQSFGAAIFGGIVAQLEGTLVSIDTCGVEGNAYMNEGNFWKIKEKGEGNPEHYVQVAGGLIGLMSTSDYNYILPVAKNVEDLTALYTKIENNVVKDLTIVVDGDFDNGVENDGIFYAIRGVGALVGNINNKLKNEEGAGLPDALDLTTNTIKNVSVSAQYKAFTFKVLKTGSVNYDSYILVGAGGEKAVGTLNEVIDKDSLNHELPYVKLPVRAEGDYSYTDTTPVEEVA